MDDEISTPYCLGATFRCTPYEAAGIWVVILFYTAVVVVTAAHSCVQRPNEHHTTATTAKTSSYQRSPAERETNRDVQMVCCLIVYFFTLAGGCLLWVLAGTKAVHPAQSMLCQSIGCVILLACIVVFGAVHASLGENWTAAGQACRTRKLVTGGLYRWCRHPMYSCFLWATVGSLLATLNWVIALCVMPVLVTLLAIKAEERVLVERFGSQYLEYCEEVSALGFPWCCLGFDGGRRAGGAGCDHRGGGDSGGDGGMEHEHVRLSET
jgi:protein-S-isoprenylcysteine O-methyltransferase Ste14